MPRNDSPGPGHYEQNLNPVKDKSVSHVMSKDKRLKYAEDDKPGPGMYESPTKIGKGPKYTLDTK